MGLKNASASFQRVMNEKYLGLKGETLEAYQDDISVGSDTPEKHVEDLRKTLKRTKEANLRMSCRGVPSENPESKSWDTSNVRNIIRRRYCQF
jgi:hypothetical protein